MTLDVAQSVTLLVIGLLTVAILLKILVMVHGQTSKMKELEKRMKMVEHVEGEEVAKDEDQVSDDIDQDQEETKK